MSFFPQSLITNDTTSSHPLFRLLSDIDTYSRSTPPTSQNQSHNHHRGGTIMRSFNPKFDVSEKANVYELHGELPGVDQKDVSIEFTDDQTVTISGRTERTFTSGTPPTGFIEENKTGAIEGDKGNDHRAKVEDENDDTNNGETSQVAKKDDKPAQPKSQEKYWVSERSVGEFSRSFTFPVRVDSDKVEASMKNGILSVVVPKAKREGVRKITIH